MLSQFFDMSYSYNRPFARGLLREMALTGFTLGLIDFLSLGSRKNKSPKGKVNTAGDFLTRLLSYFYMIGWAA